MAHNLRSTREKTMGALRVFARSLGRCLRDNSKPYLTPNQPFRSFITITVSQQIVPCNSEPRQFQYQNCRTLILESSAFVKLHRLDLNLRQWLSKSISNSIFEVSLDRPGVKNAIGKDLLRGLRHALESIDQEPSAKVAMIRSSVPGVFCAGDDLKERRIMKPSEVKDFVNTLRSTFSFLEALCVPTIAVIEGVAFGGGLEMALACDLRICGEDALMSLPETGLAIIPGTGETQRLPRLVGKAAAKDIIFTGRKINSKDAALSMAKSFHIRSSMDWRKRDAVSKIRNQGYCGSCSVMASITAVEFIIKLRTGRQIHLSPQYVIDADPTIRERMCNDSGIGADTVFDFIAKHGITCEEEYPYTGIPCVLDETKKFNFKAKIDGYIKIPAHNELALLRAVSRQPVVVNIDADSHMFMERDKEIIRESFRDPEHKVQTNHAVCVVGYDTARDGTPYWIVQNCWGENCGTNGYWMIERGISHPDGVCGINKGPAFYPFLKKGSNPIVSW